MDPCAMDKIWIKHIFMPSDSNSIHTSTTESTNIENIGYKTLNFGGPSTMKTIPTQSTNIKTTQNEVIMDEEFLHPNEHPKGFFDIT